MDKRAAWIATKFLAKVLFLVGVGAGVGVGIADLSNTFPSILPAFVTIFVTAILFSLWYLAYTANKKPDNTKT